LSAPRTDPSEPNSGTRLLPRVSDGEARTRPRMKDMRLGGTHMESLQQEHSAPGVKQQLAAVRILFG
jgi:hypothetical protein